MAIHVLQNMPIGHIKAKQKRMAMYFTCSFPKALLRVYNTQFSVDFQCLLGYIGYWLMLVNVKDVLHRGSSYGSTIHPIYTSMYESYEPRGCLCSTS